MLRRTPKGKRHKEPTAISTQRLSRTPILAVPRERTYQMIKTGPALILGQGPVDVFAALTFRLSDLPENGAYKILWSLFQIQRVELQFRPMYRANRIVDAPNGLIPEIYVAFQPDSTQTVPTVIDDIRTFGDLVVTDDSDAFTVSFRPRFAKELFRSLALSTYEPSNDNDWLPTTAPDVPHYQTFVCITGSTNLAGPFQAWNVVARYHLTMKGQR